MLEQQKLKNKRKCHLGEAEAEIRACVMMVAMIETCLLMASEE